MAGGIALALAHDACAIEAIEAIEATRLPAITPAPCSRASEACAGKAARSMQHTAHLSIYIERDKCICFQSTVHMMPYKTCDIEHIVNTSIYMQNTHNVHFAYTLHSFRIHRAEPV